MSMARTRSSCSPRGMFVNVFGEPQSSHEVDGSSWHSNVTFGSSEAKVIDGGVLDNLPVHLLEPEQTVESLAALGRPV